MYDLHAIQETARQHGLPCSFVTPLELEVSVSPDATLVFANLEEDDTILGFRDTPWHSHGKLMLMSGEATYVEYGPAELVTALTQGDVLLVTQFSGNQIRDRWLIHKEERLDLQYIEPDEALSVLRLPLRF